MLFSPSTHSAACTPFWSIGKKSKAKLLIARSLGERDRKREKESRAKLPSKFRIFYFLTFSLLSFLFPKKTSLSLQETTAFAARWDFDVTSGSPLAGGRWEWLTTARKNAAEAAAAAKEEEGGGEEAGTDLAFRPKAQNQQNQNHFPPSAACCASDVTSFPMTTSPPESNRASESPAPSCGGGGGGGAPAAAWPVT